MGDTMSGFVIAGNTSGAVELRTVDVAGSNTLTIPARTGTLITTADTGSVTNTMLAGSIANDKLANSTITIGGQSVALGGSIGGVGATGALFSVQRTTRDSVSLGHQRVPNATVIIDSNNSFSSGSCRFTPNVAGYYFVSAIFGPGPSATGSGGMSYYNISVYKNGALAIGSTGASNTLPNIALIEGYVLMNGSTDYLELYVTFGNPTSGVFIWPNIQWHGHMVRAA